MDLPSFTQRVHDLLQRTFPDQVFRADLAEGTIETDRVRFGMGNLLAEYNQHPVADSEFERIIVANFRRAFAMVESTHLLPEQWAEARDRLRLQLANAHIRELEAAITFPFSGDVRSAVVVDSPNGYAYVRRDDLERWEQTAVDVLEIAQENLRQASEELQIVFVPGPTNFICIQSGDGYDAARILLPEVRAMLLEKLAGDRGGAVYVGIPNRDFLIAWPVDAPQDFQAALTTQLAADAHNQHHPLTSRPLRVTLEKIEPLE